MIESNQNDINPGGHPGPRHTGRTKPSRKNIKRKKTSHEKNAMESILL